VLTQHPDRNPGTAQEQQDLLSEGLGSAGWHSRVTGLPTGRTITETVDTHAVQGHHDDPFDMVMRNDTTPRQSPAGPSQTGT
jgi:hypothetical protein